ncbi:unnamed protein product [Gongylonema pulchrum]|uniref:NFACT-R_1 domain-containing protein n=1 Tax=Gongylonema pulchrum TaxID=637853 RepID=A0A183EHU5_9BILA|nr:unnamed protein product [Gongylonema pulchrum]
MVDAFPLKLNCKPERYPLSACHRFDLSGKNLEAAIKRERNYELRLALQSVLKYFKRREKVSNVEESDTEEDYGDSKVEVASDTDRQMAKTRGLGGLEEELESGDEDDDVDLLTTLKKGEGKRRGKRRLEKSSSPEFKKKQKFSEVVKDLETEINEKLDSLGKGDLAWINRARSGRIVKWPVVVLQVDSDTKTCVCTELPLDDMSSSMEWCLNSEKTRAVQLKNIYLYDTVEIRIEVSFSVTVVRSIFHTYNFRFYLISDYICLNFVSI